MLASLHKRFYPVISGPVNVPESFDTTGFKVEARQPIHTGRNIVKTERVAEPAVGSVDMSATTDGPTTINKQTKDKQTDDLGVKQRAEEKTEDLNTVSDSGGKREDTDETKQLKGLLLLHLELIQQQQELLQAKDRVIASLKSDKQALKCRLDRMERRMSVLRQKGDLSQEINMEAFSPPSPNINQQENHMRGVKRKQPLESPNQGKKCSAESSNLNVNNAEDHGNHPDLSDGISGDGDGNHSAATPSKKCLHKDAKDSKTKPQGPWRKRRQRRSIIRKPLIPRKTCNSESDSDSDGPFFKLPKQVPSIGDELILRTEGNYYSVCSLAAESPDKGIRERARRTAAMVEVPTWRLNPVTRAYTLEGTENLEDEMYIKRHQKPEADEKRRKRWDLQRIREQKLYERLRNSTRCGSVDGGGRERESYTVTLCPNPDDIEFIEVCEKVPVSAFGYPIPDLKPSEFELPWLDSFTKEREDRSKYVRTRRR